MNYSYEELQVQINEIRLELAYLEGTSVQKLARINQMLERLDEHVMRQAYWADYSHKVIKGSVPLPSQFED